MNMIVRTPLGIRKDIPLGFTSKGKPIYPIAGGSQPVTEVVTPPAPPAPTTFSQADLETAVQAAVEKARQQEKDKLYGRIEQQGTQLQAFEGQVKELLDANKAAAEAEAARVAQAEADAKAKAESELSAHDLLKTREAEWAAQQATQKAEVDARFAQLAQEREAEKAVLDKERSFLALQAYTTSAVAAAQDEIAPQLVGYITGNTEEEVNASIERAKATSLELVTAMKQAQQAAAAQQRGVSPTGFTPTGPLDSLGQNQQYSAADIAAMDMQQFAEFRKKAGIGGSSKNQGLYG